MSNPETNKANVIRDHYSYYVKFSENKDEDEYVRWHSLDRHQYWHEIYVLQKDMNKYGEFLKGVSLSLRRRLLLNIAGTNFSRNKLLSEYGISKPRMLAYIENENRQNTLELSQRSALAILCRVPLEWLEIEKVSNYWSIDHFRYAVKEQWTWDIFNQYIESQYTHTIRGIIINDSVSGEEHFLRIEIDDGKVIIEIFNSISCYTLELYMQKFPITKYRMGFARTVRPNHFNLVFFSGYKSIPYPYIKYVPTKGMNS